MRQLLACTTGAVYAFVRSERRISYAGPLTNDGSVYPDLLARTTSKGAIETRFFHISKNDQNC